MNFHEVDILAVCCSVLQCVAVCCSVLQETPSESLPEGLKFVMNFLLWITWTQVPL